MNHRFPFPLPCESASGAARSGARVAHGRNVPRD